MTTSETSNTSEGSSATEADDRRFVVRVSGDDSHRVARANGPFFEGAADLVEVVVDHLVRHGTQQIMLDMQAVSSYDEAALLTLRSYRESLSAKGVVLVFANLTS